MADWLRNSYWDWKKFIGSFCRSCMINLQYAGMEEENQIFPTWYLLETDTTHPDPFWFQSRYRNPEKKHLFISAEFHNRRSERKSNVTANSWPPLMRASGRDPSAKVPPLPCRQPPCCSMTSWPTSRVRVLLESLCKDNQFYGAATQRHIVHFYLLPQRDFP